MKLGTTIKAIRQQKKMSIRTLARKTGFNFQSIYHIEREARGISITKLIAFAKALGVTLDYIVNFNATTEKNKMKIKKSKRGGKRAGAGRKLDGVAKRVTFSMRVLPETKSIINLRRGPKSAGKYIDEIVKE